MSVSSSPRSQVFDSHTPGCTQRVFVDDFDDPNIDPSAIELEDESPYPEVRSAVANTDDPTMPASTFRAWVVGLMWAIVIPGVNQFFFFRFPSVTITSVCPSVIVSVPLAETSPARKDRPPAVDISHLQVVGSLPAECYRLRCLA